MEKALDKFSIVAESYRKFRPDYPDDVYEHILGLTEGRKCAWDAGTGNGQVANVLSRHFEKVIATDISANQIAQAASVANIQYLQCRAEHTNIVDTSIDLITVAQAIHWFDQVRFAEEVSRIANPGAILAVWGYELLKIRPEIDKIILELYNGILNGYWSPHRRQIENQYSELNFPFQTLPDQVFHIRRLITIEGLLGYLRTWSAVSKYRRDQHEDPVSIIEPALRKAFVQNEIMSSTPVFLRLWRISES